MNARYKRRLKLSMAKLLNTGLIRYDQIVFKLMQVHENEKDQAIGLEKEAKCLLLLLHNRDTKNKK